MGFFETTIESCSYEVRRGGILGKKYNISLLIYENKIRGEAFDLFETDLRYIQYDLPYERIYGVNVEIVDGKECVVVEYKSESLVYSTTNKKLVFWGISDPVKWANLIARTREKRMEYLHEKSEKEREDRQRKENEMIQYEKNAEQYYMNCYTFHIQDETPVYTFSAEKNVIVALYVSKDKALNFLYINGYKQEENVGIIPYDKIHYYEKAGNVSYTTEIHGSYSSYGGSFTGGHYSKTAAAIGGLLFGFMGMTAGALFSYKPATQTESNNNFSLDSEVIKIDDRNIILNFYSDVKKQYIDIELPQEIYNFLQTYLPEKKYGIVEEMERKAVIHQSTEAIQSGGILNPVKSSVTTTLPDVQENTLDIFKMKVDKLKMMKEAGLLSEQEFEEERKKLLKLI